MLAAKPLEDYLKKNKLFDTDEIKLALSHKSAGGSNYERLEFLGDAVLGAAISDYLYCELKKPEVGILSKTKGYLVSRDVLYKIGVRNNVLKYFKHGIALKKNDIKRNKKIISDIVEAIIGAIYLLKGYDEAKKILIRYTVIISLNFRQRCFRFHGVRFLYIQL